MREKKSSFSNPFWKVVESGRKTGFHFEFENIKFAFLTRETLKKTIAQIYVMREREFLHLTCQGQPFFEKKNCETLFELENITFGFFDQKHPRKCYYTKY